MLRIREELGPEAVIIQSRKVRLKGIKGLFAPRKVEITAAVKNPLRAEGSEHSNDLDFQKKVQEEIGELKMMVSRLMNRDFIPADIKDRERGELQKWRLRLQQQEVLEELIDEFMEEIQEGLFGEVQLTEEITGLILQNKMRKRLKTAPEKGAQIQVFVGPTGVERLLPWQNWRRVMPCTRAKMWELLLSIIIASVRWNSFVLTLISPDFPWRWS